MRNFLPFAASAYLFLFSINANAQAPSLGSAASFGVFTSVGAIENIGNSEITGNIGTGAGAFNGFPPGIYTGTKHVADAAAIQAATEVNNAYAFMAGGACPNALAPSLGGGQIITPGTYCIAAAASLNGDLILDGQGDPNAEFIIKIDAAFATGLSSRVLLINNAVANNVYWQVGGQFDLGDYSEFTGTIIVGAAVNLYTGSSVTGRVFATAGAISLYDNTVGMPFAVLSTNAWNFSATKQNQTALLRWSAPNDAPGAVFTTERSSTGIAGTWEAIGSVSTTGAAYSSKDVSPFKGTNYYRVKMEGSGGTFYSNIIPLTFTATKYQISVYPNPAMNEFVVRGTAAGSLVEVIDLTGRIVYQQKATGTNLNVDARKLSSGNYIVKVTAAGKESSSIVINKQ